MEKFKLDDRVTVIGKKTSGKIAFVGETHFSEGEWFGIILDEAKGRNNGSVDGHNYFKCARNHGLFVRSCQLQKEDIGNEKEISSNTKRALYPNYLINSTYTNRNSEKKNKTINKTKSNTKLTVSQNHPMNTVIEDLKNNLKSKSEEIFKLVNEKKEVVDKHKVAEREMQKVCKELKRCFARENDLKLVIKFMKSEITLLKRKLCKTETSLQYSENKRKKLEMTIESLREITEHAIIEKEIAEEKCEQSEILLKEETDKFNALEIKLDTMKEEMTLQSTNGVPAVHYVKKIENENELLKCALFKLRDLYENLHRNFSSSKKEIEKYSKEIEDLKRAEEVMEDSLGKYENETSELYDIIDSISDADDIVFEITERNLKSEDKIKHLYQTLDDMETELEVDEEVEETLQEIRFLCRDEIEILKSKLRHTKAALDKKSILIDERQEIIEKYRMVTFTLQEKICKLTEDLEVANRDRKKAVLAAENLKLQMQREKRNIAKSLIEKENMKYDLEHYKDKLGFWGPFMPDNFFDQHGENTAIEVKLVASKMLKKLNFLITLLKSPSYDAVKLNDLKSVTLDTMFITSAYKLYGCISLFIKSSDRIDVENFLTLGKYLETLEKESKEIDLYLISLANDDIDKRQCANNMDNTCHSLSNQLNSKYATDGEKTMIHLSCYLNMIQTNCNCLQAYCKNFEDNQNISSEFKSNIKIVADKAENLKVNAKLMLNFSQTYESEKIYLVPLIEENTKNYWSTIEKITNYVMNKYESLIDEDSEFIANDSKDEERVSLNQIVCECISVDIDLYESYRNLSNGEYFDKYASNAIFSSVCNWAEKKKREREQQINTLKCQISTCNREINILTENLQKEKNKINKIQILGKKDESQQTEDQNYCTDDFSTKSSCLLDNQPEEKTYCTNQCSAKTNYLLLIMNDMESTMKYLRQKNFELMNAIIKDYREILKPLKVLPKPKYHQDTHTIFLLQKRLNKLSIRLRESILPKVVDITRKTSSPKDVKYKVYLAGKLLTNKEIGNELWHIAIEIRKLKRSRSVWSNMNLLPFQNVTFTDM